MSDERALRVTDAQSKLQARLTIVVGRDGGASGVDVELTNLSADEDVVVKVNSALSAFITLTVTDEVGSVLSKPARKFNSAEIQHFEVVRIAPLASRHWRVPIAKQVDAQVIPASLHGRLVVNVLLLFSRTPPGEQPQDDAFSSSVLTLYDMDVQFTRAALSEGEWASTNGH